MEPEFDAEFQALAYLLSAAITSEYTVEKSTRFSGDEAAKIIRDIRRVVDPMRERYDELLADRRAFRNGDD